MRRLRLILSTCLIASALTGCPKRDTGEIDVDEIQGRVDEIESHLKDMRAALKAKDLDGAQDHFNDAEEIMEDNKAGIEAYPEAGELKGKVRRARSELCFGFVDVTLAGFFTSIKAKEIDEAQSRLKRSQKEMARCEEVISRRDDYGPLKMNLESAPQLLAQLEKQLAAEARLQKIREFQAEVAPRLKDIDRAITSLEGKPNQPDLVRTLGEDIGEMQELLREQKEFEKAPEWAGYVKEVVAKLAQADTKRIALARVGMLTWVVNDLLPKASQLAAQAVKTPTKEEALPLVEEAHKSFVQCEQVLQDVLKQDPALMTRFTFRWEKIQRNTAWLKQYCLTSRQLCERMVVQITKRKPAPVKTETILPTPQVKRVQPPPKPEPKKVEPKKPVKPAVEEVPLDVLQEKKPPKTEKPAPKPKDETEGTEDVEEVKDQPAKSPAGTKGPKKRRGIRRW